MLQSLSRRAVLLRWVSQELKDVLKSQRIASEVGPRQCQSERLHGRFQAPAVVQRQNFETGGALYGIALYAGDVEGSFGNGSFAVLFALF